MEKDEQIDYLMDNTIDGAEEAEMFQSLAKVGGFEDYLKKSMAKDMQRYFASVPEHQATIRGGYLRSEYLLKKIIETKKNLDK